MLSLPSVFLRDGAAKSRAATVHVQLVQMFRGIILAYIDLDSRARRCAMLCERGIEAFDQRISVKRLDQKADRARLHGSGPIGFDGEGRDENEREAPAVGNQAGLQVEPAHRRHPDIGYHAGCVVQLRRVQEFFGRRIGLDRVAKRPDKIVGRGTDRHVIVDD